MVNLKRDYLSRADRLAEIRSEMRMEFQQTKTKIPTLEINNEGQLVAISKIPIDELRDSVEYESRPLIPDEVFEYLPNILKRACEVFEVKRERDVFFTSAITVLSGCFNNVSGLYDNRVVYPNLFGLIVANAASGKGVANFAKELAKPIHKSIMAQSQATNETESIGSCAKRLLFIPANSSTAAVMKHLEISDGSGIIFETEVDTFNNTQKNEWSGYSDILRKCFHHEPLSISRKTNDEYFEIEKPKVSLLFTGTPGQIIALLPSIENGLFSRFLYYTYHVQLEWKDVSPTNKRNLTVFFEELSKEVFEIVEKIKERVINFDLTPEQWKAFNIEFAKRVDKIRGVEEDAASVLMRMGIITFRIAMLLATLRMAESENVTDEIICTDEDFTSAMFLSGVYFEHAMYMKDTLPNSGYIQSKPDNFYVALPNEFSRKQAVEIGKRLGICERKVGTYLHEQQGKSIKRTKHGQYHKI